MWNMGSAGERHPRESGNDPVLMMSSMVRKLLPLVLLSLATAAGSADAQDPRPLTALDLYHLKTAAGVALSPDGARVVYVVTEVDSAENRYRRDLWITNTDGSGEPRRLTWTAAPGLGGPAFSPDGRSIAFTASRGGSGQIWILPLAAGGEAWPLTELPTGASGPVWSPDGTRIAFTSSLTPEQISGDTARSDARVDAGAIRNIDEDREAALAAIREKLRQNAAENDPRVVTRLGYLGETSIRDERYSQLYVTDVRPGATPTQLTNNAFGSQGPAWSPDGEAILYSAGPPRGEYHPDYELESDLHTVPAAGGTPRRIEEPGYAEYAASYTPDGRHIVYVRRHVEAEIPTAINTELMVMRADGSERRSITGEMDRGAGGYEITGDGWLYFTSPSEGATALYRTRLDRIRPQRVVTGARGVQAFDVARGTIAWAQMQPSNPSDVYAARADGARERRLTALNDSLLAQVYVGEDNEVWYPSFDGLRVQGWYILPIDHVAGSRPPLAVQIHGGPHAMWGPGEASMWLEYQMLAGAGYTVFFSNPRGSGGYGEAGLRSIYRDWGTSPARDILIGADTVIARGLADPARQVVTGGSYAGYMTAWLVAHEAPERFRAAVAARGVYDLGIWYGSSNTWRLLEGEFGVRPWEDWAMIREQSPLTYVANIQTPLLMLHSDTDFRTTIAGAEALYRAMTVLGKEVEFVRYPREGHELTRSGEPKHRVDHMLRTLEYFERYVR
jgi:dipeptidyl aminopeptidase/acylaminoacyl peptidase